MALRGLFQYRNQDSTKDLNDRFGGLVVKGVFDPGTIDGAAGEVTTPVVQPVAGQLNVEILGFVAVGNDGMAIVHEVPPTTIMPVQANLTQYVLLRSAYTPGGNPDLLFEVMSSAAYTALVTSEKNKRIILAKITLGPGATEVTNGDIDLRENDIVDKRNRSFIRGVVAAAADLPLDGALEIKRVLTGDVYLAISERQFYRFDGAAWQTVTDGAVSALLTAHLNVSSYEMPTWAHPGTAIRNVAAGNLVATNVQTAINELDTEKVAKAGDTMTGKLTITAVANHAIQATASSPGFVGGLFTGSTGAAGLVALAGSGSDGAQVFGNGAGAGLVAYGGNTNGPGVVGVSDAGATPVFLNCGVQGTSAVTGVYGGGGSTGVWGYNLAGGDGVYGEGAVNGVSGFSASASGNGVLGAGYIGVRGNTSAVAAAKAVSGVATPGVTAIGDVVAVHGSINGTISGGTQQAAVLGDASAATATGVPMAGVWGIGPVGGTLGGVGVYGIGGTGNSNGVLGVGVGTGTGVVGNGGDTAGSWGVVGNSGINSGIGVLGNGFGASAVGVKGTAAGITSYAVWGEATTTGSAGVRGTASAATGVGVLAAASGDATCVAIRAGITGPATTAVDVASGNVSVATGDVTLTSGDVVVTGGNIRWIPAGYAVRTTSGSTLIGDGLTLASYDVNFATAIVSHADIGYVNPDFTVPAGTYRVSVKVELDLQDTAASTKTMTATLWCDGAPYDVSTRWSVEGAASNIGINNLTIDTIRVVPVSEDWKVVVTTTATIAASSVAMRAQIAITRIPDNT